MDSEGLLVILMSVLGFHAGFCWSMGILLYTSSLKVGVDCLGLHWVISRDSEALVFILIGECQRRLSYIDSQVDFLLSNCLWQEITGGIGVDIAVEALGRPQTFQQCTQSVRDGGKAVMIGLADSSARGEVDINRLVRRQVYMSLTCKISEPLCSTCYVWSLAKIATYVLACYAWAFLCLESLLVHVHACRRGMNSHRTHLLIPVPNLEALTPLVASESWTLWTCVCTAFTSCCLHFQLVEPSFYHGFWDLWFTEWINLSKDLSW